MKNLWIVALLALFSTNAFAERSMLIFGQVDELNDSTFTVLPETSSINTRATFELQGVTLPQKGEAGYQFSQQWLKDAIVGQNIELRYNRKTRKGVVSINKKTINTEAVRAGAATPDLTYRKRIMTTFMEEAKSKKLGIWAETAVAVSELPKLATK